ncbi:hypothetical protein [Pantoea sp. SM3]|uniref:hypothetical protein n=1 Tax=Pantoea sp. SM3 TaxID=1628192 RepID=UPI0005F88F73|nr:hypothetical protein [Pantoea sp. SM3]KJV32991.1 hypothetical protein VI01_07395 [Pantoea sp. SM3]
MDQGFYWVQQGDTQPEVWYFADGEGGGWFKPNKSLPVHPEDFVSQGYNVISERLAPPGE